MDDAALRHVMSGKTENLPPIGSQVVRIFTSSTFTDTVEERNTLMEDVYPKLRDYCRRKFGLDFQVVDMRWGVRDEATDDHMTSALCMEEIRNCQKLSTGPNFVTFLGQRHGSRIFPPVIDAREFEVLREHVLKSGCDVTLLDTWFLKDKNAADAVYVLQPISSQYSDFLSQDADKKRAARDQWSAVYAQLEQTLRDAVVACVDQQLLTDSTRDKYFMSVTEEEIQKGVLQSPGDAASQCLCYIRIIEDLVDNLSHSLAWRYIDMDGRRVNEPAQQQLTRLRDHELRNRLREEQIYRSSVKWNPEVGISRNQHSDYLKQFSSHFHDSIVRLVDKAMGTQTQLSQNELLVEVMQHAKLAADRCAMFLGRDEILQKIRSAMSGGAGKVVVIHGVSGCGKTSIIAKTSDAVRQWFDIKNGVVITRFLGTTPNTSTIHATLENISRQIIIAYDNKDLTSCPVDFSDLLEHFHKCLKCASADKPLYIFMDSLDQLSSRNGAHKVAWLPTKLPEHCHIIVSTLTDMYDILTALERKIKEDKIVEVKLLGDELGLEILRTWMDNVGRKLSVEQLQVVSTSIKRCSLPLYVKLVFDQVQTWRSYMPLDVPRLSTSVREVINDLFERVERKHGSVLVRTALGYITASRSGLSESELEDVLSLDDTVLCDVFQYHVPPIRRIPPILWIRIRHDISSYLVTREADGVDVVYWYHRQFIEAAINRYTNPKEKYVDHLHKTLAEYFDGKWHKKSKPFTYTKYQMAKLKLKSPESSADRRVSAQPLVYELGTRKRYNLRKLNNLPYHLFKANETRLAKKSCFFSYQWLHAKLEASGIHNVLADFDMMTGDSDVDILWKTLHLARSTLNLKPGTLGLEISGRLLPHTRADTGDMLITKLVEECYSNAISHNCLYTPGQCYNSPEGNLQYYLENESIPTSNKITFLSADGQYLCMITFSNDLMAWEVKNGEFEKQIQCLPENSPILNAIGVQRNKKVPIGCAFQTENNPVIIVDLEQIEVEHVVYITKVYKTVGFAENYQLHLLGDKLLIVVIGKEADYFDVPSGQHLQEVKFPPSAVCVTDDMSTVLIGNKNDASIAVFDAHSMNSLQKLCLPGKPVSIVHGNDAMYVTCESVYKLFVYKTKFCKGQDSMKIKESKVIDLKKFNTHEKSSVVRMTVMSPTGKYLVIYIPDVLLLWDTIKNKVAQVIDVESVIRSVDSYINVPIKVICFSKCERFVFATHEEHIFIWNVSSGQIIRVLQVEISLKVDGIQVTTVFDQSTNSNLQLVCTTCRKSNQIKVWNWEIEEKSSLPPLHVFAACRYMVFAAHQPLAIVRSYNANETGIVNLKEGVLVGNLAQDRDVARISVSLSGKYSALCELNQDVRLRVYNVDKQQQQCIVPVNPLTFQSCKTSKLDKYIATNSEIPPSDMESSAVEIWKLQTGKTVSKVKVQMGGFENMEFADNDRIIMVHQVYSRLENNGRNTVIFACDVESGNVLKEYENVLSSTMCVTPDGNRMFYVKTGKQIEDDRLVTVQLSGEKQFQEVSESSVIPIGRRLHLSADGNRGVDTAARAIDLVKGQVICQFQGDHKEKGHVLWPKISANGEFVVCVRSREALLVVGRVGTTAEVVGMCYLHANPLCFDVYQSDTIGVGLSDGRITILKIADVRDEQAFDKARNDVQQYRQRGESKIARTRHNDVGQPHQKNTKSTSCSLL